MTCTPFCVCCIVSLQIGLVIARRTPARDLVLHLAPTPPTEEGLPPARVVASSKGSSGAKGSGGKGSGRGGGGSSSSSSSSVSAPLSLVVDSEWVLEQTAQATRRLPGGLTVAGVYCSAPRLGQPGGPGVPPALHPLAVSVGAEVYAALKSAYDPFAGAAVGWESGSDAEASLQSRAGSGGEALLRGRSGALASQRRRRRAGLGFALSSSASPARLLPTAPPVFAPLVLLVDSTSGRVTARAAEVRSAGGVAGVSLPTREVAVADLSKQLMAFETTLDVAVTVEGIDLVAESRKREKTTERKEGEDEDEDDDDSEDDDDDDDRKGETDYDADSDARRGVPDLLPPRRRKTSSPALLASLVPSPQGMAAATARELDAAIVLLGGRVLEPGVPLERAAGKAAAGVLADADRDLRDVERAQQEAADEAADRIGRFRPPRGPDRGTKGSDASTSRRGRGEGAGGRSDDNLSSSNALDVLFGPTLRRTIPVDLATPAPPGRSAARRFRRGGNAGGNAGASDAGTVAAGGRASLRAVVGAKEDSTALLEALRNDAAVSALARGEALLETRLDDLAAVRAEENGRGNDGENAAANARTGSGSPSSALAPRSLAMPVRVAFPWPTASLPLLTDVLSRDETVGDAWQRLEDVFGIQGGELEQVSEEDGDGDGTPNRPVGSGVQRALALEREAPEDENDETERGREALDGQRRQGPTGNGARSTTSTPASFLAHLSPAEKAKFGALLLAILVVVIAALLSKLT